MKRTGLKTVQKLIAMGLVVSSLGLFSARHRPGTGYAPVCQSGVARTGHRLG